MKMDNVYKKVIAGFVSLFSTIGANAQAPVDSGHVFSHYTERSAYFHSLPDRKGEIIFLGNSITEAGRWNDILPDLPVANRGISGDISFGVVARLDEIVSSRPAKVFLMIGVNDLKREIPAQYIIRNYRLIVEGIRKASPKTKIYLQSMLPVNNEVLIEPFRKVTNEKVKALNEALQQIADEYKVTYVDLHEVFADANGELKRESTPDGIHLKPEAYGIWVAHLKEKSYL